MQSSHTTWYISSKITRIPDPGQTKLTYITGYYIFYNASPVKALWLLLAVRLVHYLYRCFGIAKRALQMSRSVVKEGHRSIKASGVVLGSYGTNLPVSLFL